ncbi:MAG: hypothetical protein LQ338_000210 [Usnochroma carphineum]|nr:MAG: hypothetical protein LQ338_000210 [Usnochroma carphineum]
MRGATILKATDDKTRELNRNTLMAFSGEAGDTVQFAEFIQANIQLYSMRNDTELGPPAVASFVRGELARSLRSRKPYTVNLLLGGLDPISKKPHLYWLDYLASLAPVPYAAHGYAQYYCLSILDKHHHPDIDLDNGLKILRMCTDELQRRLPIDFKGMGKRQAEDSLEDLVAKDSPLSKKARVDDTPEYQAQRNGHSLSVPPQSVNGHRLEDDARNGNDILAAADQEQEELEEAAQSPQPPPAENGDDEEQSAYSTVSRQTAPTEGYSDLYLDTINRSVLDFDFEKLCSVTLSNINVYACLVCGKYYQGRGPKSNAYFHALEVGHHVYVNMQTKKVYVLPEGYEVKSKSLEDIKFVVDPKLSKEEVMQLDKIAKDAWDLSGKKYRPGFVGMNNIKENDYFNVIIQALAHVPPLRNFFMLKDLSSSSSKHPSSELATRFSILVRKIWNTRAFKTHVSPHELIQQVSRQSNKKFDLLHQSDPVDFLSWFLNNMHLALGGARTKPGTSIIHHVFQGKLKTESQRITAKADAGDRLRFEEAAEVIVETMRYLILTLDLPPAPLFQDELDRNIIPQVPLTSILSKYDGVKAQEHLSMRKRYRLLHPLPPYLLFHIKRFSKNKFVSERNPTIVTFPVRSLDMSPYVEPNPAVHSPGEPIWYDLVANVTHEAVRTRDDSVEGEAERKVWRVQVRDRARDEWLQVQDLFVERVATETLFTKESYLMVWERRREGTGKGKRKG